MTAMTWFTTLGLGANADPIARLLVDARAARFLAAGGMSPT